MLDFPARCDEASGWPLPGSGATAERFDELAALARRDLVVGRLVEAHADAVAILAELGGTPVEAGQRWGVWAAGPADAVTGTLDGRRWHLAGTKRWCSGATLVTHALVDAATHEGSRLFCVDLSADGVAAGPSDWVGPGMARSDTRNVTFSAVPAVPLGGPGDYLTRPGFWAGAAGVAACWLGGATRVADLLSTADRGVDPHFLVHLGAVHCSLTSGRSVLHDAARRIDEDPAGDHRVAATTARSVVERAATEVMDRVGRALGPAPLARDAGHSALVADLTVYIRQHHGESDLAELGRGLLAAGGPPW